MFHRKCNTMPVKAKRKYIILTILAIVAVLTVVVNQISVYPFMWRFRGLMSLTSEQGDPGNYEVYIQEVVSSEKISVSVEGYPDAYVTFYSPEEQKQGEYLPVILYIHGGGWSAGNAEAIAWYAKLLASNGYVVANVDYSLAPEHPYPASTVQLVTVLNYLYENAAEYGINEDKIFVGGNSAGAHLASQLGALVSNTDYAEDVGVCVNVPRKCVRGLLLFNGVYNFDTVKECNFPFFTQLAWSYTGQKNFEAYARLDELSTAKHVTEDYPATFITVGDADPLRTQTKELIDVFEDNSVNYRAILWDDTGAKLGHDYVYEMDTREAQIAYEAVLEFLAF